MSFFPRGFISEPSTSFTPLFRLLDEYGDYTSSQGPHHHRGTVRQSFAPKFDVKELPDSYELYGELPGIEQKDVDIEFTDNSTLTIRGRTERSYTSGTPPRGFVEGPAAPAAIESGQSSEHKATVEDEPETSSNQVTKGQGQGQANKAAEGKFWVSERSVGEFSRSFSFPERVDQENVRASMKNGILSVVVPKAKKQEKRKIAIS